MTSIRTKSLIAVGAFAMAFAIFGLSWTWFSIRKHTRDLTTSQAKLALTFDVAIRKYVGEKIRPLMEQRVAKDEFIPEAMSTSFVARQVFEEVRKEFPDYVLKFSSDHPRNPENVAGLEEMKILEYFRQNPKATKWVGPVEMNGKEYLVQCIPRRLDASCIRCHGRPEDAPASLLARYGSRAGFHRSAGDLAALDTVGIPMDKVSARIASDARTQLAVLAVGVAILTGAFFLVFRLLIGGPLDAITRHFKNAAAQSEGATLSPIVGAGTDEIGILASAFNSLAARLQEVHASLERRVLERTVNLEHEIAERKRTEESLQEVLNDTERVNRLMQGRETRIAELKLEVNALRAELGRGPGYNGEDEQGFWGVGDQVPAMRDAIDTVCDGEASGKIAAPLEAIRHPICDLGLEKPKVDIAFIPILCAAPLLYAKTHGYFARNGLDVTLTPAPGWSGVKNLLAFGHTDAAHLLSAMPLAIRQGIDGRRADIRLACIQNVNGQALTLAKKHARITDVREMKGFTFGVPYHFSMHYYLLCLFLAEHGLDPLRDVSIIEVSPPRMPHFLETGRVDGVFAPEPFNQIAVYRGTGFIYTLSKNIWLGHPCCCFASTEDFIRKHPKTYRAMLRSVLEAELALHQASPGKRKEVAVELSQPGVLNQSDPEPVAQALSGEYDDGIGQHRIDHDRIDFQPTPWPEYGDWILSQQQRWKQLRRRVDYREVVERCFDPATREIAGAMGFEEPGPNLDGTGFFPGIDPFGYMQSQPFSAFEDRGKTKPPPIEGRIARLSELVAAAAAGRGLLDVPAEANDDFGSLERLTGDLLKNIRFAQDALQEQNETLERAVELRITEIDRTRRNAVSIAEDAERARRAAEAASRLAEAGTRAKTEFLANMSHEIRTPMTAILGYVDLLLSEDGIDSAPERFREAFRIIKRNGEHLLDLINDVLDLSKVESGKLEVQRVRCSPFALLAEVVSLMRVRATEKSLSLEAEAAGLLPETVLTDPLRLRQILVNVVGNAIKFTNRGKIRIVVRLVGDGGPQRLQFDVIDTGIGMSAEQMAKLFQPFSQVDSSASRKFGGTGLGLAISKRLVEAIGGSIEVRSAPGKGSTFSITIDPGPLARIPLVHQTEATVERASRTAASAAGGHIRLLARVLLAEDGLDNQRLISVLLNKAGAEVTAVENGQLAMESALAQGEAGCPFDVILMDMQMPVLDGYEATRALRARGYAGPIIALTAHAMVEDRQKCLDAGCDDYTTKPIDRQRLLDVVARWADCANSGRPTQGTSAETFHPFAVPDIGSV